MPASNGNLSVSERQSLPHGAVVAWQTSRMEKEQTGTVERVIGTRLVLCDGCQVCQDDYCKLVSETPTEIREAMESKNHPRCSEAADDENDAPETAQSHASAPKPAEPPTTPAEEKPPAAGQGLTRKAKPGARTVDRALYLEAIRDVIEHMGAGFHRSDAIARIAAWPKYAKLTLTDHSYGKWVQAFRAEGVELPRFTGGTNGQVGDGEEGGGCCAHGR